MRLIVPRDGYTLRDMTEEEILGWNSTFRLVVDRPFMFTINESSTGAILFMGKVVRL